jgi:hypothetical protein
MRVIVSFTSENDLFSRDLLLLSFAIEVSSSISVCKVLN